MDWIDRFNRRVGGLLRWCLLAMVLFGAFNAVARYLGRFVGVQLSSNAFIELQWYLFSLIFLLGAAYTFERGAHVRVDVLFANFSPRLRAWIDLLGTAVLLVPFCLFGLWASWPAVRNSWSILEASPDPGGLPRYPIKSMILVGFALLMLQGLSFIVRRARQLRSGRFEDRPGRVSL